MKLQPEVYKGIEFVRVSSLAKSEQELFWKTFEREKIIRILQDNELLNDCVQFKDYQDWRTQQQPTANASEPVRQWKWHMQ
ncbi:MAG: hypothetical protein MUC38_02700 [Cyclobacteriaceae bacterium]|nr:hypothetical protein [Cyclobacteriaceae bacterium]